MTNGCWTWWYLYLIVFIFWVRNNSCCVRINLYIKIEEYNSEPFDDPVLYHYNHIIIISNKNVEEKGNIS